MLVDANSLEPAQSALTADVVLVGAGTVGLYLAALLRARHPQRRILVIEAGSRVATTSRNAATSQSVGRPHSGTLLGRAAGLGGTSALWGGQLAEFRPSDLQRDDAPWPVGFDTLREHYRQVYRDLGLGSPKADETYRRDFGRETEPDGAVERVFTYWLRQPNFAALYKQSIHTDSSLVIVANATANRIDFEGARARRLECTSSAGRVLTVSATSVVFTPGTLAAVRFFLSAARRHDVPWKGNQHVGRYFQDHLGGKVADVAVLDEQRFRGFFENGWVEGIKLQPKLAFSEPRPQATPIGVCGIFSFESGVQQNVANIKALIRGAQAGLSFSTVGSAVKDAAAVGGALLPIAWRYARQRRVFALFDRGVTLHVQAEQIPTAASQVRLANAGVAEDGMDRIEVDWRCDGGELSAIRDFAREADSYLQSRGLARLAIDSQLQAQDPAFLERLADTYHPSGGLRMSSSASSGVVDSYCRVWGTSNVWVAGAAVFPSSSFANCTLTALALAARLAPRIEV